MEQEIFDINESNNRQISILRDEQSSLKNKIRTQENTYTTHLNSINKKIDSNEQHERRDALVLSGPLVPEVFHREDLKRIIQRLLRSHTRLNVNVSDISTAHCIGKTTPGTDERNIIFKLCLRDLVQAIFSACKTQKSAFYTNTSLTPLQNKILYGLRLQQRKYSNIVKACKYTITGK